MLAIGVTSATHAAHRPVILEESARIVSPDPDVQLSTQLRIDGNDLLVVGRCAVCGGEPLATLFHFARESNGAWTSRGVLATAAFDDQNQTELAFEDGLAVFLAGRGYPIVLERTGAGWTTQSLDVGTVSDVAIQGSTIALGSERSGVSVVYLLERNGDGVWSQVATLQGAIGFGDNDFLGPDLRFGPNEISAGNYYQEYVDGQSISGYATHVFDSIEGVWRRTDVVEDQYRTLIVDGRIAFRFDDWNSPGDVSSFYTRGGSGAWDFRHSLITREWFADKRPDDVVVVGSGTAALAYAGAPHDDARGQNAGSVAVFDRPYEWNRNRFEHVATLLASDAANGTRLGASIDVDERRVAAYGLTPQIRPTTNSRISAVYVFELPDPLPAPSSRQDTFDDQNASDWLPQATTNWQVVASNGSYVFRQSNVQGDARAIYQGFEGTNQSITADLKVNSFADPARHWAGMMVRYTDPTNFYYLMNNGTGTLQIRKIVNGIYGPIASVPFQFEVGRTYRMRFEAIGTRLRAYADGRLLMDVTDTAHERGRIGFTMWKANVDYDNVVVTSSPLTTLHADSFAHTEDELVTPMWTTSPANAWVPVTTSAATVLRQTYLDHDARAVHGASTEDQIITADVRVNSFHPDSFHPNGGFAGLMARYQGESSYYYVLLRSVGGLSLRRLGTGKRITIIDEEPFTVVPGRTYRLRFEAIGSTLRLYVDGKLMLQGEDSTLPEGRYGLVTYRAQADYDNFIATRP